MVYISCYDPFTSWGYAGDLLRFKNRTYVPPKGIFRTCVCMVSASWQCIPHRTYVLPSNVMNNT